MKMGLVFTLPENPSGLLPKRTAKLMNSAVKSKTCLSPHGSHLIFSELFPYGVWRTGVVSDKMVQEYLEHHRDHPNTDGEASALER